jgi:hypothetical protein
MSRWTAMLVVGLLARLAPACAALESWDQFSGPGALDAGPAEAPRGDAATPPADAGNPIALVQASSRALDNLSRASVDVPYDRAQVGGDLNVVVIGWYDLNVSIKSVTDTAGNTYQPAGSPASITGPNPIVQAVYYAPHVAAALAGANVVTVAWNASACSPDVRVLEFRGVDSLDLTAASSGVDTPATVAASAPTKDARELLVVGGTAQEGFSAAGQDFTVAVITSGLDLAAYRVVGDIGTYSTSAPLTAGKSWVMQLASFR